jgi:hypothetical protein
MLFLAFQVNFREIPSHVLQKVCMYFTYKVWYRTIRLGRKSACGSGIRDEQPGSYFLELRNHFFWVKILKFFKADPEFGVERVRIRDPGWKKVGSGIRDKHSGSATL